MTDDRDDLIRQLTIRLRETVDENDKLRAENERLNSALGAHGALKAIYSDSTQPATVRVRAASAALGVESAPLKPVEQLELKAEAPPIPLAELVTLQRARADRMEREAKQIRVLSNGQVLVLDEPDDGNGSDDTVS